MITSKKTHRNIAIVVLSISVLLWILMVGNPGNIMTVQHCPVTASGPSPTSLQMLLEMNPVSSLLAGWILMVGAMMLPKLIMPIQHIYDQSLKRRRFRSALLFTFGYVAIWAIAGLLMVGIILGFSLLIPQSYLPAILVGIIAVIWQFSPVKQQCLNRGHNHQALAAFGWKADRDAFLFGVMHGIWCVGSGWALMLFPMLLPEGHNLAMLFVTFLMLSEHMEHPRLPRWRVCSRAKLMRILLAQIRISPKNSGG